MDYVSSQLHLNVPLSNFAVRYNPPQDWFTWRAMLPIQTADKRSDYYRRINPDNQMRRNSGLVGEGAVRTINRVNMTLDPSQLFFCKDYSWEAALPRSQTNNADPQIQIEQETIKVLKLNMNIDWQVTVQFETLRSSAFGIPIIPVTGNDQFDSQSPTSSPIDVLRAACDDIEYATGHRPNHVEMHKMTWRAIQSNPRILARSAVHVAGEPAAVFTVEMLAKTLEVEVSAIKITSFSFNNAEENAPIVRRSPLGPDIIIAYNEAPSLSHFGLGVTFMWAGDAAEEMKAVAAGDPALASPIGIYSFFDPNVDVRGGQIYRAVGAIDFKITNPRAGKIITNAVNPANTAYNGMLNLLYS